MGVGGIPFSISSYTINIKVFFFSFFCPENNYRRPLWTEFIYCVSFLLQHFKDVPMQAPFVAGEQFCFRGFVPALFFSGRFSLASHRQCFHLTLIIGFASALFSFDAFHGTTKRAAMRAGELGD